MTDTLRIGTVPFLVGRPLVHGLDREDGVELTTAPPSRLAALLREGALDMALVSSVEAFRRPGYQVLTDPCVAADGPVDSVLLMARRPLEAVGTLAIDPASLTGATLARVVLDHAGAKLTDVLDAADGVDPATLPADAWVRIGDAALDIRLGRAALPDGAEVHDLSAAWKAITDLPFVFACWICRPGLDAGPAADLVRRAAARGREAIPAIARAAAEETGHDEAALGRYLSDTCVYRLDPGRFREALHAFRDAAARLGLADPTARPTWL